jgi:hypothetical protein
MINITKELQQTLLEDTKIKEVYFDESGRHYFRVFSLIAKEGDREAPKMYGKGLFSHRVVIAGDWNVDKLKETICKGDPESLIVNTVLRDDILKEQIEEQTESLASKILNASSEEKAAIIAALGLSELIAPQGETKSKTGKKDSNLPPAV